MEIRKPTSWAHKAKHGRDSTLIVQDLCSKIDPTSTGDNLPITHQIVIDCDQIKESRTHLQEHK